MTINRASIAITLFITLFHVDSAAQQQPSQERGANEVRIHEIARPETLNLITSTDAASQDIHGLIYETLLVQDRKTLETIPWIAESRPRVSSDRMTYEFTLRRDATFSDGAPITGRDFIFYLKSVKNHYIEYSLPLRGYYSRVEKLELIDGDPYRLRAVMTEPNYLAEIFLGELYAFPQHIWDPQRISDRISFEELNDGDSRRNPVIKRMADVLEDKSKDFSQRYLVGSGVYMFEEALDEAYRIVLKRNPNYWNRAHEYGSAYPERVIYQTIHDPQGALDSLKAGAIDFVPMIEKALFNRERDSFARQNLRPAIYNYPAYNYIGYNMRHPLFADRTVRTALAHAINMDAIIRQVYFGFATPVRSPILRNRPEYDSTIPIIKYDLKKAKSLLAQAGWADTDGNGIIDKVIDGKKTEFAFKILLNSGNRRREQIAVIFIDALKKLGINAGTTSYEWATFLNRTRDGDYDAFIGGWALNPIEGDMYQIWHSESIGSGGSNVCAFANERVDRLIDSIRAEFDFERRKKMYREIQRIIHDEQPYNFLVQEQMSGVYSDRLENLTFLLQRPCYSPALWRIKGER